MVVKLSKKVYFLQYYAKLGKKSKSIKTIYRYASERFCYTRSENGIYYYAMTYWFGFEVEQLFKISTESASLLMF